MTTHTCLSYTTKPSTSKVKNVLLQCWHKHLQNKRHKSNPPPSNRAKYEWGSGLMGLSRVIFRSCFSPFIYIKRRYVYKDGGIWRAGVEVCGSATNKMMKVARPVSKLRFAREGDSSRISDVWGSLLGYWGNKGAFYIYIFFSSLVGRRFCLWEKRAKVAEQRMSEKSDVVKKWKPVKLLWK